VLEKVIKRPCSSANRWLYYLVRKKSAISRVVQKNPGSHFKHYFFKMHCVFVNTLFNFSIFGYISVVTYILNLSLPYFLLSYKLSAKWYFLTQCFL